MTVTRNITFPDEVYDKMVKLSEERGVSIAAIIKIACSEYVEKQAVLGKDWITEALENTRRMDREAFHKKEWGEKSDSEDFFNKY